MSKPHFNLVCLLGLARWDGPPNGFGLNIFFLLLVVVVPPLSLSSQQTQDRSPAAFRCSFRFDSSRVSTSSSSSSSSSRKLAGDEEAAGRYPAGSLSQRIRTRRNSLFLCLFYWTPPSCTFSTKKKIMSSSIYI